MFIHGDDDNNIDHIAAHRKETQPPQTNAAIPWPRTVMGASAGLSLFHRSRDCRQQTPITSMEESPTLNGPVLGVPSPQLTESWTTSINKSVRRHPFPCDALGGSPMASYERTPPIAPAYDRHQCSIGDYATEASMARMLLTAPAHCRPMDYTDTGIAAAAFVQELSATRTKGMPGAPLNPFYRSMPMAVSPTRRSVTAGPYSSAETATAVPRPEVGFDPQPPRVSGSAFDPQPPRVSGSAFDPQPPRVSGSAFDPQPHSVSGSAFDQPPPRVRGSAFDPQPPRVSGSAFDPPPPRVSGSGSFFSITNGPSTEPLSYYHSLIATDATPADHAGHALLDGGIEKENVGAACDNECGLTRWRTANDSRCGRTGRSVASSMASWVLTSE
jgi:hypothetical protein